MVGFDGEVKMGEHVFALRLHDDPNPCIALRLRVPAVRRIFERAAAGVIHQALLPKLVHEMTDPRPGGAYHLCQVFLPEQIGTEACAKLYRQAIHPGIYLIMTAWLCLTL